MNTPDGAPKDGDFVAYLAELEQRQMQAHRPPAMGAASPRPGPPTPASGGAPAAARMAADVARAVPVGLAILGFALLIAGLAADGGMILILLGAFLVWQAVRAGMRRAGGERSAKGEAAERIATLLAGHAQGKKAGTSK